MDVEGMRAKFYPAHRRTCKKSEELLWSITTPNPRSRKLEHQYLDRRSLWLDFKILAETMLAVLREPRWLLPLGNTYEMLQGWQSYKSSTSIAGRLKSIIIGTFAAGFDFRMRRRMLVASREPLPLEALVAEVSGEHKPVFALSLGPAGILAAKLTLQVMRPSGEILGYIKLPLNAPVAESVRHEAETLERLSKIVSLRPYVPKLLYSGKWADGYVLFQSPGPQCSGPIELGPLHEEFLQVLGSAYQIEKPGADLVCEVAGRWRKATALQAQGWRQLGERALERANQDLEGTAVHCGITHGDFTPWNTQAGNGRLFVFDWELASWDKPILWDVFHFRVQVAALLKKENRNGSALAPTSDCRGSLLLYLLDSLRSYLKLGVSREHSGVDYRFRLLTDLLS